MLPEEYMRRSSVEEYTETMRQHYTGACRTEKSRLLDEFIRVTGVPPKVGRPGAVGHQAHQVG